MNRTSIRGVAQASAVVAASTAVTIGAHGLAGGKANVTQPAAINARPAETEQLQRRKVAARQALRQRAVHEARQVRRARERASRSAFRTSTAGDGARGIAAGIAAGQYGWGADQFSCLDSLWERESGWDPTAANPSSGAYGIPQALPGSKMSAYGSDWQTDPVTQVRWGLDYIESRHGTPCGAWGAFQSTGWY